MRLFLAAAHLLFLTFKFGAIPLPESSGLMLDSLRHSRLGLYASRGALAGYLDTDFLNSPENQPLRRRQYWGEFSLGNWRILGGRAWSLLRPNRTGTPSETVMWACWAVGRRPCAAADPPVGIFMPLGGHPAMRVCLLIFFVFRGPTAPPTAAAWSSQPVDR